MFTKPLCKFLKIYGHKAFLLIVVVLHSYHHGLVFFMVVMVLCSSWLLRCWCFFRSLWSCVPHGHYGFEFFIITMVLVFLSIIMVFCSSYLVGINAQFLAMANLLFNNVATSVDLNRSSMVLFITQRSLWRGCSVTPYLFIIMTEVFNMMVYKGIIGKKLAKIVSFNFKKQKIYPINIWHQFHHRRWKTIFG